MKQDKSAADFIIKLNEALICANEENERLRKQIGLLKNENSKLLKHVNKCNIRIDRIRSIIRRIQI